MKLEMSIVIMLLIDITLFLSQTAMANIAMEEGVVGPSYYDYQGGVLRQYDAGNYTVPTNVSSLLPSGQGEVVPNTGSFFTDIFSTVKNWFLDLPGVRYVVGVVTAVPNMLQTFGLPPELSFAIGALWHVMTFVLLIGWLFNR